MELPKWANAFKLVLLVQPSAAFYSILQCFTAQHQSSLEDYLELDYLISVICACTLITVCKKRKQNERANWVNRIGRFVEIGRKKANFVKA